jgi:heme/copper-type cytochrome/quinol oxidase subunit 2
MTLATIYLIWWISIILLLVVTGVVALLLTMVLKTARSILGEAEKIWTTGKMVANNTIHIPLLVETNRIANGILATAVNILSGANAIEQHAESCPG